MIKNNDQYLVQIVFVTFDVSGKGKLKHDNL
jgi:hypothetical protein